MSEKPSPPRPLLTIGMATFDDFDGIYFTVTSLMLHHQGVMEHSEIVVVDNNPESRQGRLVRDWMGKHVPNGRYFPFAEACGTAPARNEVFRRARGEAVLCIDCHVLLVPGAIQRLLDYYAAHPGCRDLLTGPLVYDSGQIAATHQQPRWSAGAWGVWSIDERGIDPAHPPFEIWQQGLGLFSCRKEAWVGFHAQFRGFGGCESYIMEKFRRNNGRVLCCPWLRWTHRFPRSQGVPYPISRSDTLRNYLIGFEELGIDPQPALVHYRELESKPKTAKTAAARSSNHFAVIGDPAYGGVQMRGMPLSRHLGGEMIPRPRVDMLPRQEVIIAIKDGFSPRTIRSCCDRLIYDPLDAFCDGSHGIDAVDYWKSKHSEMQFDDILATSPACRDIMREALPESVGVHLVPHHGDPRIHVQWKNPAGPVCYAGLPHFIQSGRDRIQAACQLLGKPFVSRRSIEALKGSSLALALRLSPYHSALNRLCKPQVKIANALAAGLPVVSTDCPAAVSLHPDLVTVPADFTPRQLAAAMQRAFQEPRAGLPYHLTDYLAACDRILGRPAKVVYTAIFGGYDQLRDPKERLPGVQYVCFTDNPRLKSEVWTIRYCPPTDNPLMQAKRYKILGHETLDCDLSLWIDGRIQLESLKNVFEWLPAKADLAVRRHAYRSCAYVEAQHCKRLRRGDPDLIDRSVARFRAEGHPPNFGLWQGGIVLRRHNDAVKAFNQAWWKEVTSGTPRDQISLPAVLRRLNVHFETMPNDRPHAVVRVHQR